MSKMPGKNKIIKEISFSLLAEGKTIKIRADGYSMFPTIKPGSIIYIEPICMGEFPVPGEIVAWKRKSGLVVHRLIRIINEGNQMYFVTRGDSCAREDQPILAGYITGRVIKTEDKNGNILENRGFKTNPHYRINRLRVIVIHLKKILRIAE
jgi:signal peptidase I